MENSKQRIKEIEKEIEDFKTLLADASVAQNIKDWITGGELADREKEMLCIKQSKKVLKTDVFFNPFIFSEYHDYVLGGFKKDDLNSIKVVGDDSTLSFTKLKGIFEQRLMNIIENYRDEIRENILQEDNNIEDDEIENRIQDDINTVIENYLEIKPSFEQDPCDFILENDAYRDWLSLIRERLTEFKANPNYSKTDVNKNVPSNVDIDEAEDLTETTGLWGFLEALSNIQSRNFS